MITTIRELLEQVKADCPNVKVTIPEGTDIDDVVNIYPVSWDIEFDK